MSKNENKIKVDINLNVEALHSAMKNADRPEEAVLAVPVINPKELCIDDEIYGVTLGVITPLDGLTPRKEPNAIKYPAINKVLVNALNKSAVEGYITVNGSIDLPVATGKTAKLESIYVTNEAQARTLSKILIEVQLEKIEEEKLRLVHEEEFLLKQKKDNRY